MTTLHPLSTLPRQLELNLAALSRAFRQALRYALKHDPLGTPDISEPWRTVAARQAQLQEMMQAVAQFLRPHAPAPEAPQEETPAPENAPTPLEDIPTQIQAVLQWPAATRPQKRRQARELQRLQKLLERQASVPRSAPGADPWEC